VETKKQPDSARVSEASNRRLGKFQFYAEDSERFTGDRALALVRELNPDLQTFAAWLTEHKDKVKAVTN
jgi:hypothetical protein